MQKWPPFLITAGEPAQKLVRLQKAHDKFDEAFLQELLADHPELLPVDEFRPDVGDLLCIGREVSVGEAGSIDNLYLSTGGYPVIVETKLWRNPQARREVLSQILDYVKEIVEKDYDWLSQQWDQFSKARKIDRVGLLDKLSELSEDIDQETYIDRVNRALSRGDILALIVGDGIETKLQALVSHLCRDSAHLRYSLGLIELSCYFLNKKNTETFLIVPRLIQEVEPVERAFVRVEFSPGLERQLKVRPIVESVPIGKTKKRTTLSEDEFFNDIEATCGSELRRKTESFYNDLINTIGLEPDFKSAAVILKIHDPNDEYPSAPLISLVKEGKILNSRYLPSKLKKWGMSGERADALCRDYWAELNSIEKGFLIDGIKHVAPRLFVSLDRVADKFDLIKFAIEKVARRIKDEMNSD
jgi:hypothetical protein